MFLDAELATIQNNKERLVTRMDLSREVVRLEVLALGARARRVLSASRLGFGLAGKVLEFLRSRRQH